MKDLSAMIHYLEEAIQFQTATDIIDFPEQRQEFQAYVNRCKDLVPSGAVPYCVLVMLNEERSSRIFKIKKLLGMVK